MRGMGINTFKFALSRRLPLISNHEKNEMESCDAPPDRNIKELSRRKLTKIVKEQYAILENIPVMIYLKDDKGRFIRINRAFHSFICRNIGRIDRESISGKKDSDIFTESMSILFLEDREVQTGKRKMGITRGLNIGGKTIWLRLDKIPLISHGKVEGLIGVVRDITDYIEREKSLRENKERFERLAETSPFVILVFQIEKIVYANGTAEKITGFKRDEIVGEKFWDFVHPDYRDIVRVRELDRQRGKDIRPYECKIITKSGEEKWLQITGNRIIWEGMPAGIITAIDITTIKIAEKSLRESEKKFRTLAECSPLDIVVVQNERIVYTNFEKALVTGYSREELLSMKFLDIVHLDFREKVTEKYRKIISGKHVSPFECKLVDKNGEEKWVLLSGSLIEWGGEPSILVIILDITDRKRAEEEALKAKKQLENILHAVADGIRIVGMDYRVKMINRRMARMARVKMSEGIGMVCSEMFRCDQCGTDECSLRRVLRTGKSFQTETLRFTMDGKAIPCLQYVTPLRDTDGNVVGIIEDFRDISMIKRTEKKLRRAHQILKKKNEQLEKLNNLKSLFLNITSHELRTPMAAIKGYVQLLEMDLSDKLDEKQKGILHTIVRNIDRLDRLINDILDVSRLESGTLKIVPEKCRVEEIIDRAIETMRGQAEMKDIKIEKLVEYDLPELFIDKYRMEQVVTNLLSNAIKFSNRNSRIIVRASKKGDKVVLEIQDFGRGIPKNKLKKIFEPFYQVDSGMDRKFGGAGLGLTIVKGIVEAHGGNVEIESKVREGTTFRIILPTRYVEKERKIEIFSRK
ncbi:MAG: PAS domain S-box protein [Thermoplasmata archaeon]|nr:MAG: PAS domain S-box protein [Thermoplasmata archaeon]